ncbi:MAG: cellulase family glycosylhydrolase [Victivallales bacterium]|nr:cellulase family glycosylhydrolase [Victivallales bacterium]
MLKQTILTLAVATTLAQAVFVPGKILWQEDFKTEDLLKTGRMDGGKYKWLPKGSKDGKSGAVEFTVKKLGGSSWLHIPLDPKMFHGNISIEAYIRGEGIKVEGPSHLGPKFSLSHKHASGISKWPNLQMGYTGTYDWKFACYYVPLGDDCTELTLHLGLQSAQGTIAISNIVVREMVDVDPKDAPKPPPNLDAAKIPRGDGRGSQYRGVMSGSDLSSDAFATLHQWGANLMRYQVVAPGKKAKEAISTPEKYLEWIDREIKKLDTILPRAQANDIKIIIDLHTGPGTTITKVASNEITEKTSVETLCQAWAKFAQHYRGNQNIYGYDLLNEPQMSDYNAKTKNQWQQIVEQVVATIRKIDPDTPILVAWHQQKAFVQNAGNIIYTPHYYTPHMYSHQGVLYKDFPCAYPGWINGEYWDKERIRLNLKSVIELQKKYNLRICVGEFGASVWCTIGREKYIEDCISIFEEYGWDWCYHAFREWPGWSAEHVLGPDRKIIKQPDNPLERTLKKAFKAPRK